MSSNSVSKTGFAGSLLALFAAACCILPVVLMTVGLGGSWVIVFAKIAAVSYWVTGGAALLLAFAWIVAIRTNASRNVIAVLVAGTLFTLLALCLILNEAALNDFLISRM